MSSALILSLEYDPVKTEKSYQLILKLINQWDNFDWTLLHIDNAHESHLWEEVKDCPIKEYRTGGDNQCHEFSGWDKGWKESTTHLGEDFDLIVIINDAIHNSKPTENLSHISNQILKQTIAHKGAIGWTDTFSRVSRKPIDTLHHPMRIFGHTLRKWVCSTCIIFSKHLFLKVYPLTSYVDIDQVYQPHLEAGIFKQTCGLNKPYQDFLIHHQTQVWKKGGYALTPKTFKQFKYKTRAIINESLLGHRIFSTKSSILNLSIFPAMSGVENKWRRRFNRQTSILYYYLIYLSLKHSAKEIVNKSVQYYSEKKKESKELQRQPAPYSSKV